MGLMRGIRKNVKGIYWIVTIAVVVTFIFWGTRLGSVGGRRHAGVVFGKKVSMKEFELQWRAASRVASSYGRTPSADLVEAITWQRLVELRAADRWGIIVPMDEVRDRIRVMFSRQGIFDEEAYRDYLFHGKLTEEQFAESIRDDLKIGALERVASGAVVVPPDELRERYNYEREERKIKFHMVEVDPLLPAFDVSEDGEEYYHTHRLEFREPKKVAVQYLLLETAPFLEKVSVPDEELKAYYEANKSAYKGADGKTAEFDAVKQQIERVLKLQKADAMALEEAEKIFTFSDASNMKAVAAKNGLNLQETGLIAEEGPAAGDIVNEPEFSKFAFSTDIGRTSPVFKTNKGYCVLSPSRVVPARELSYEEARTAAAEKGRAQRLREEARQAGLSEEEIEAFLKERSVIPSDVEVTYEEALNYYETAIRTGEFMKPKRVKVQYLMIEKAAFEKDVKVTEREIKAEYEDNPSEYKDEKGKAKPLEEVRGEIEKALRARKAGEMAKERADEILIIPRPQRMKQRAERYGLKLRESELFARGERIDDYVGKSAAFADAAFATSLDEVSMPFATDIGYCVLSPIQVVDETGADFEDVAAEAAEKAKLDKAAKLADQMALNLYEQVDRRMSIEKKDFEAACKELNLKVEESGYFRRFDTDIEKVGKTEYYTRLIFDNDPGKIRPARQVPGGSFFYVVSEVKVPSDEEFAKDKDIYYRAMAREKGQEAFREWSGALMREANPTSYFRRSDKKEAE